MKSLTVLLFVIVVSLHAMESEDLLKWERAQGVNRKYPMTDALHPNRFYTVRSRIANELIFIDISHSCAQLDDVIDVFVRQQNTKSLRLVIVLKNELHLKSLMLRCFLWAQHVEPQKLGTVVEEKEDDV